MNIIEYEDRKKIDILDFLKTGYSLSIQCLCHHSLFGSSQQFLGSYDSPDLGKLLAFQCKDCQMVNSISKKDLSCFVWDRYNPENNRYDKCYSVNISVFTARMNDPLAFKKFQITRQARIADYLKLEV